MWKTSLAVALLVVVTAAGCASSGGASQATQADMNEELTLRNRLEQMSQVTIRGRYGRTRVYLRGASSLSANAGKQPLFVVDGVKRGRSFYRVASLLTPEQIVSVEVLVGAGANLYGSEGFAGVIVIKTNRGK